MFIDNVKVKFTLEQATKAQKGRYSSTLSLTSALDRGGWSMPRPGCFTPGMDPVPTVQEAGWAPGPVWMGAENLAPLGFDPWIHPVASHYTNSVSYIYIYIYKTIYYRNFGNCCLSSEYFHTHAHNESCTTPAKQPKQSHLQWYLECVQLMATYMVRCFDTEKTEKLTVSKCGDIVLDNGMCLYMLGIIVLTLSQTDWVVEPLKYLLVT